MIRWFFSFVLLACAGTINCSAQSQYQSPIVPEATLENTRRALESLPKRVEPIPDAKKLIDVEIIGLAILVDVIQQHANCFLRAEAAKAKKTQLLDYELTEAQRRKMELIFSPQYRAEILKTVAFEALKMEIASSVSQVNSSVLSKALELSREEVGVDFVLAWLQPVFRESIDKSCGANPGEGVFDDGKSKSLWELMFIRFSLY